MAHLNHFVTLVLVLAPYLTFNECNANPLDSTSVQLNDDVLGLIVFKSDLHDPQNTLSSWNEDDNSPCSWRFVRCTATGRVSELSMEALGLSGKLGRGLKELQSLKALSLSHNNLTGNIGTVMSQLPASLQRLNLSHNRFSDQISTSMANMNAIRVLDLSENLLAGTIPDGVFGGCSLQYLSLAGNSLEGSLPATLTKCSLLNGLILANNRFSGNPFLNQGIFSLSRIRVLDLSNNGFSGPVPVGMLALHKMKELHLHSNQFSGPIPHDIGYCPHLNHITLSNNQFTGALPDSLQMLTSLTLLAASNNMLTGEFPQWIGNLTSLESIDFSENSLTGSLPVSVSSLGSLKNLILSSNNLSGSIPDGLFSLGLEQLDMSWNKLTGTIPPGSSRFLESLLAMDLSGNNLTGSIPPELELFANMEYLNLSRNSLHSTIPPGLGYLPKLKVLDLRHSTLNGFIPRDICGSGSLSILQLDGNTLTGSIPAEIGNCSSLSLLTLSHNNLTGLIPRAMMMLKKLEILKLEFNQLSGEIPSELGILQNLQAVNVSYNRLVGRLPQSGIFPSLDETALQGNLGICSPLLKGPCKLDVPKPLVIDPDQIRGTSNHTNRSSSPARSQHRSFLSLSVIIAIAAAAAILAGVITITLLNASTRRKLETIKTLKLSESMFSSSPRSLTDSSLAPSMGRLVLFDSTSPGEHIPNPESLNGLKIGGRQTSIKKLPTTTNIDDFDKQARQLGRARHPNLVPLRGYYYTPNLHLLISDYISDTTLHSLLHQNHPPLPWPARFKIILGAAKALSHLHHSCNPPITHGNLNPSNVIIDHDYNPRLSNFGLQTLIGGESDKLDRKFGYIGPEGRVSEKGDVYGYGVVVMEIVTGRRAVEYGEDNVVMLSDEVRVMVERGRMIECVDECMGEYLEEEVVPVLKLAMVCTSQVPSTRSSMAEVVKILEVIKTPVPARSAQAYYGFRL